MMIWRLAILVFAFAGAVAPVHGVTEPCEGDCDGDGRVTVAELVRGVRCRLSPIPGLGCTECFVGSATINTMVRAVANSLNGCTLAQQLQPATPTPTPDFEPTEEIAVFTYIPYRQCPDFPAEYVELGTGPGSGEFDPTPFLRQLEADGWTIVGFNVTTAQYVCAACGCPVPGSPILEVIVSRP